MIAGNSKYCMSQLIGQVHFFQLVLCSETPKAQTKVVGLLAPELTPDLKVMGTLSS